MTISPSLFSSRTDLWETPQWLYDRLNAEFNFNLDVCATHDNAKCQRYFTKDDDGLSQPWSPDIVWMNPPYGNAIYEWIRKGYEESTHGATVVALIPSRTDTKYWHEFVMRSSEIRFVRGRLRFGDATNSAPFPSAIIVWNGINENPRISTFERKETIA